MALNPNMLLGQLQGNYAAQQQQQYANQLNAYQLGYGQLGYGAGLNPFVFDATAIAPSRVVASDTPEAWLRRRVDEICWKAA